MPVPTSRTRWLGRISAKATRRSLTGCAACSCVGHHFFQPGATVSHSWRCPALYWTGSKDGVLIVSLLCGERPNATLHLPPEARARDERRLEAVRCSAWLYAIAPPAS